MSNLHAESSPLAMFQYWASVWRIRRTFLGVARHQPRFEDTELEGVRLKFQFVRKAGDHAIDLRDEMLDVARKPQGRSNLRDSRCKFFSRGSIDTSACDRNVSDTANAICFCKIKAQRRERMHNQAKQPNIPAEIADNLIGSLGDLTAIEGAELRRHVIMLLIDHSYALGYVAGAGAGLVARMRSRLALAEQDIKLALSSIRERLAMIFRDHGRRSHQLFPL